MMRSFHLLASFFASFYQIEKFKEKMNVKNKNISTPFEIKLSVFPFQQIGKFPCLRTSKQMAPGISEVCVFISGINVAM